MSNSLQGFPVSYDEGIIFYEDALRYLREVLSDAGWTTGRASPGGSLRRCSEIVGDLDVTLEVLSIPGRAFDENCLAGMNKKNVSELYHDLATQMADILSNSKYAGHFDKVCSRTVGMHSLFRGTQLDVFPCVSDTWTATKLFWTGSRWHNQDRMLKAHRAGYDFSPEGIYDLKQKRLVQPDESDFLVAIGLNPVPGSWL